MPNANSSYEPMNAPHLTTQQQHALDVYVSQAVSPLAGDEQITNEDATAQWVETTNDADVDAWFAAQFPHLTQQPPTNTPLPPSANTPAASNVGGDSSGRQLATHLNSIEARDLSFAQAANLGVELVHHADSLDHQIFHTANGDIIYFNQDIAGWDVVDHGRNGQPVRSGNMERVHQAYISNDAVIADTAIIADTATVEPGAQVGPHSTIGEHAHIGAGAIVASYVRVEDGAFVGAYSSVRDGSRVGPGAVVGAGSRIGATTNIGAGARLEQHTEIGAFDNVTANSRVGGSTAKDRSAGSRLQPQQISHLVDRLAALDRD